MYQAITRYTTLLNQREVEECHFERATLSELRDAIIEKGYDSLPDFTIELVDGEGEMMAFDDTAFLRELRADFDESVIAAHYQMEAGY